MKITYIRTGTFETHYKDEWDLEISAEELSLLKSGQHPDYNSIEEWAEDQWDHSEPATRSNTEQGDVYDGDIIVEETTE